MKEENDPFEWYHHSEVGIKIIPYGSRKRWGIKKLIYKIPMRNIVIDQHTYLYYFWVVDGKIVYEPLCSATT